MPESSQWTWSSRKEVSSNDAWTQRRRCSCRPLDVIRALSGKTILHCNRGVVELECANRETRVTGRVACASAVGRAPASVAFWRKSDNGLGARLRLIASSSDELEKARS